MESLKLRLATDPVLIFAKEIMSPDYIYTNIVVPERLRPLINSSTILSDHANWIVALKTVRSASVEMTPIQQIYRIAFKHLLDFCEEVSIIVKYSHEKCHDWLYRYFYLMTCPIRWVDSQQTARREEIRNKINAEIKLTQEEKDVFNDIGIYQTYSIYEKFIRFHNPMLWQFMESFTNPVKLRSFRPAKLPFTSYVDEDTIKIDRYAELLSNMSLIDYRGLWTPEQRKLFIESMADNVKTYLQDFYESEDDESEDEYEYESDDEDDDKYADLPPLATMV